MDAAELRRTRKDNPTRAELLRLGWYHSFRFEDGSEFQGVLPVEVSEHRYSKFSLPSDLTGKRVLDIGAWDGWFSFEAERHGAAVTAIDMVEVPNFWTVHRQLRSHVTYRELDLFDLPHAGLLPFDYVFFLGVLYHTKYPLLALELVCGLTLETAIVESYVTDSDDWEQHQNDIPTLEFYETDELGGQLDNWCGPTVGCLMAMSRAAGFARVEVLEVGNKRAALACHRRWLPGEDDPTAPQAKLRSVTNSIRGGINFRSACEEYLTWWFEFAGEALHREEIRLEVGPFGVPSLYTKPSDGTLWLVNSRLPPGMQMGWVSVRMSIRGSAWSEPLRIAVDIRAQTIGTLAIDLICDGLTWVRNQVNTGTQPGHLSVWVTGLGENSDEANTRVLLDGTPLTTTFIGKQDEKGSRQVNAALLPGIAAGVHQAVIRYGGVESDPRALTVVLVS